jgi:DNA-directed RNA polymerase beta subunit
MYHGIILDMAFDNPSYPEKMKIFAERKSSSNDWILYGVEIADVSFDQVIKEIQMNMKSDKPYYSHFYNDEEMVVVFKEKLFRVKPHISTWTPIIEYGKELRIPKEQLDFWPNRFQDEVHYFDSKDFVK